MNFICFYCDESKPVSEFEVIRKVKNECWTCYIRRHAMSRQRRHQLRTGNLKKGTRLVSELGIKNPT